MYVILLRSMGRHSVFVICYIITSTILVLPSAAQEQSSTSCNPDNLLRCWSFFQNASLLNAVIPYATLQDLNDFCSRYDYFVRCYNPVREKCFNVIPFSRLVLFDGEKNALGYLCIDGKNDYLSNQQCFSDPTLQIECQTCKNSLSSQIDRAIQINDTLTRTTKLCQAGELYLGCINNNLKVICTQDAAAWMMEYNKRSLYPLFSAVVCPGWEPTTIATAAPTTDNKLSIILGVCLTFFCIIIIILTAVSIVYCLKTRCYQNLSICPFKFKERNRDSSPPPYLQTVSYSVDHQLPYKSDSGESCVKGHPEFDTCSMSTIGYFTDEKSSGDKLNNISPEMTPKSSPTVIDREFSAENSKSISPSRPSRHRASMTDSGFGGAISSVSGSSFSNVSGMTVNNNTNGNSKDHTISSHISRESNGSNPNTSCTSTPSMHFERPVANPFTRLLSNPDATLPTTVPGPCVASDYYC